MAITPSDPSVALNTDVELTSTINNALWTSIPSLNAVLSAGTTSYKKKFQASVVGVYDVRATEQSWGTPHANHEITTGGELKVKTAGSNVSSPISGVLTNVGDKFSWTVNRQSAGGIYLILYGSFSVGGFTYLDTRSDGTFFHFNSGGGTNVSFATANGDIIECEVVSDSGNKNIQFKKNGSTVGSLSNNNRFTGSLTLTIDTDYLVSVNTIIKPLIFSNALYEATNFTVYAPISLSLARSASSVNLGSNVTITPTYSGGYGTKTVVWEESLNGGSYTTIDTTTTTAKTFTAPSVGLHTIRLSVEDDSGSDIETISFFVGSITGPSVLDNSETGAYTSNVSNPVWTEEVGNGSFSSNSYTAVSSGTEVATIKVANSADATQFATKQVVIGYPRSITTTNPSSYTFNSLPSGKTFRIRGKATDTATPPNSTDWSDWEEIST